ncbi:FAD-binding protein, partial [Vibrio parahaemolyticus]
MAGSDEQSILHHLQDEYPHLVIVQHAVRSLFGESKLPFRLLDLPETFTQLRKCVEGIDIAHPIDAPCYLPPMPNGAQLKTSFSSYFDESALFSGGEWCGLAHCRRYFSSGLDRSHNANRKGI